MDRNVIELIGKLRISGLQISPAETIDCLNALQHLANPAYTKDVLTATLVKRAVDLPIFEKVYRVYYSDNLEPASGNAVGKEGNSEIITGTPDLPTGKQGWKELFEQIKENNQTELKEMVSSAVEGLGELKQQDAQNFNNLLRKTQVAMEWFMAENQLNRSFWDIPYEEWLEAKKRFEQLKQEIEDALRKKVKEQLGAAGEEEILKQLDWRKKDFGSLRDEELAEMERRIDLLGKRLASRRSRRRKSGKKGIIDIRRLLRKSAANPNFVPSDFYFLTKIPAKPRIALLCDISGSVARYSRFMLQLIYIFAKRFPQIKAYVFVDAITEVTDMLKEPAWKTAFDKIFREAKCSQTGYSDYGKVFESFNKKYLEDISNKTSVIILGDARNNWFNPQVEEFAKLAERANRILWLNPQEKELWNTEDSIIGSYLSFCDAVEECRDLEHLEEIVKKF